MPELQKAISARITESVDLLQQGKQHEAIKLLKRVAKMLDNPENRHLLAAKQEG